MRNNFECLANELLHEIFDYFSLIDLIKSFNQLNKRFSRLLSQRFVKCDLSHLSKNQYENLIKILPLNQINYLKISNKWTLNIFSRIPFNTMTNLQTLILSHINYNEIHYLFESKNFFRQLNTFKIQSINLNGLDQERIRVLKKIFSQMPKLRLCQIPFLDVNDLDELIPTLTLEQLIIDYCTMSCLGKEILFIL